MSYIFNITASQELYRTDEQGTVTFTGSADGSYKVTTEK